MTNRLRRFFAALLAAAWVMIPWTGWSQPFAVSYYSSIQVLVDGAPLQLDVPPVEVNGRVLVPLRGIFERLGAEVKFTAYNQSIRATLGDTVVEMQLGNRIAAVNGEPIVLDVPPGTVQGRTMVPLRFVSEALGADVHWDGAARVVSIDTAGISPPATPTYAPPGATPTYIPPTYTPPTATPTYIPPTYTPPTATPTYTPPAPSAPLIYVFSLDTPGPLHPGDQAAATLNGDAGGAASFDIAGLVNGVSMAEIAPGTYRGAYQIPSGAQAANAAVYGHLRRNGLSAPVAVAAATVTVTAAPNAGPTPFTGSASQLVSSFTPADGAAVADRRPEIRVSYNLQAGESVDPATVHLTVNGQDVTGAAIQAGHAIIYNPAQNLPMGTIHASVAGRTTSARPFEFPWSFAIQAPNSAPPAQVVVNLEPADGMVFTERRPQIYAQFDPGAYSVDLATVRMYVNGQNVTLRISVGPHFVRYNPTADLPAGVNDVRVTGQLIGGSPFGRHWQFTVQGNGAPAIQSVTHSASAGVALHAGEVLLVTMTGTPGGHAAFDIGAFRINLPMQETMTPGRYAGTYTVQPGDAAANMRILGKLYIGSSPVAYRQADVPVTLGALGNGLGDLQITFTAPPNGAAVGQQVTIQGATQPNATVQLHMQQFVEILGPGIGYNQVVGDVTAQADGNGRFIAQFTVQHPISGSRLEVTAQARIGNGLWGPQAHLTLRLQ